MRGRGRGSLGAGILGAESGARESGRGSLGRGSLGAAGSVGAGCEARERRREGGDPLGVQRPRQRGCRRGRHSGWTCIDIHEGHLMRRRRDGGPARHGRAGGRPGRRPDRDRATPRPTRPGQAWNEIALPFDSGKGSTPHVRGRARPAARAGARLQLSRCHGYAPKARRSAGTSPGGGSSRGRTRSGRTSLPDGGPRSPAPRWCRSGVTGSGLASWSGRAETHRSALSSWRQRPGSPALVQWRRPG